ncbi:MAG: hypothetical protein ACD_13C00193G0009 [uncultured bacterium]|nr:MAG: hypothetical protein ACD_13C00193G0009 [uncultured bacterium]
MEESVDSQKTSKNYLFVGIFLFLLIVAGGAFILFDKKETNQALQTPEPSDNITSATENMFEAGSQKVATPSMNVTELEIEDIKIGTGEVAVTGKKVTVNYSGTLTDGTKFDSSYDRNEPFSFTLGVGEVIVGWDKGVEGMKVGGKRKLTIPSSMAYGDGGIPGAIPGGATLIFEVELLSVE